MVHPINVRAINQARSNWPINAVADVFGGGLSAYAVNGNDPKFVADFAGTLNSGTPYFRKAGSVSTFADIFTYTGASNKTMVDSDGNLVWAPHNLHGFSGWSGSWAATGGTITLSQADPDGGTAGALLDSAFSISSFSALAGATYRFKVAVKAGTTGDIGIGTDSRSGTSFEYARFDVTAGTVTSFDADFIDADISPISGATGWYWVWIDFVASVTASEGILLRNDGTLSGDGTATYFAPHVYRIDLGGMVNNPDRVDSYVPTTSAAVYLPRRNHYRGGSKKGILLESAAATNLALQNRDFTNAAWTKSNMTAAKTATGIDGVTNSASTLTATAGNATALQAITSTSAARVASMWVKRRTGSGTVEMTQDNGSTWTAVTVTAGWTRVYIPAITSANPTVGIRIVTSGDAVDVDLFQHEVGSIPTSEIPTTSATATRAAETKTAAGSDLDASTTAMSFHLAGEENYADLATAGQVELFDWRVDANNRITVTIDTDGAKTGTITLTMVNGGSSASVAATTQLTPGLNKAFNIAWRVTGSEINIALDGTAATATATAIGVPDLSSASAAFEGRGTRSIFRQAAVDWTDAGIEEATS